MHLNFRLLKLILPRLESEERIREVEDEVDDAQALEIEVKCMHIMSINA